MKRRLKTITIILGFLALFSFDRFLKWLIINKLPLEGVFVLPAVQLKIYLNPNLAFSLPFNQTLLIFLSSLIIILLFYLALVNYKKGVYAKANYIALIITGATSNLLDRLIYKQVIDYVSISILPIFNLADILITLGIGLWITKIIKEK